MNSQRKSLERCPARQRIHEDENRKEDELREIGFFNRNLSALNIYGDLNAASLFANFVRDRKACDGMLARFDLLTSHPSYSGIVADVELDVVTSSESIDELDLLKSSYQEMIAALITRGYIDSELSREQSHRHFEVRGTSSTKEHIVVARNRQLALGSLATQRGLLRFEVSKRMVFELPTAMHLALVRDDLEIKRPDSKERYETQVDGEHSSIYPIRTAYLASTWLARKFES